MLACSWRAAGGRGSLRLADAHAGLAGMLRPRLCHPVLCCAAVGGLRAALRCGAGLTSLERRKQHLALARQRAEQILGEQAAEAASAQSAAPVVVKGPKVMRLPACLATFRAWTAFARQAGVATVCQMTEPRKAHRVGALKPCTSWRRVQGLEGKALIAAVAAAEKLQAERASTQETVLAQEVDTAPAVELISGDGDVSTTGAAWLALPPLGLPCQGSCVGLSRGRAAGHHMCRNCV